MNQRVFSVVEGEIAHYFPYVPHGVFSEEVTAVRYGERVKAGNQGTRWPNIVVIEFEINRPGHIRMITL